jgi:hypothetical protein
MKFEQAKKIELLKFMNYVLNFGVGIYATCLPKKWDFENDCAIFM